MSRPGRMHMINALSSLWMVTVLLACSSMTPYSDRQKEALEALDTAARYSDEFGSASITTPMLVPVQKKGSKALFSFNPGLADDQIFKFAREESSAQSASALYSNFALGMAVNAKANVSDIMKDRAAMESYQRKADAYKAFDQTLMTVAQKQLEKDLQSLETITGASERATKLDEAKKNFMDTTGMEQPPTYPDRSAAQEVSASHPQLQSFASSTSGSGGNLLDILNKNKLKTPVRSALLSSAGDKATLGMLNVLMDPSAYGDAAGKKFLFGVSMVSVRPGWRTSRDFTADVNISTSYEYRAARYELIKHSYINALDPKSDKQPYPNEVIALIEHWNKELARSWKNEAKSRGIVEASMRSAATLTTIDKQTGTTSIDEDKVPEVLRTGRCAPLVLGVSPIVDVQNMDSYQSSQQTIEVALQIAAALTGAGYSAAADVYLDYARRLEKNKQLRASLPMVVSHSTSGQDFGFLISPRMKIGEAGDGDPVQMMGLEAQGFPVLVLVQMDNEDIGLHFRKNDTTGEWEPVEPQLVFDESTRWKRFKKYWWWYDTEQSEEQTILLRSRVSELKAGMIGFDELRNNIRALNEIRQLTKLDKQAIVSAGTTTCSEIVTRITASSPACPEGMDSLRKLLDSALAVSKYQEKGKREKWMTLTEFAAANCGELKSTGTNTQECVTTQDERGAIDEFYSVMKDAYAGMQPTRRVFAELMEHRSDTLSLALAGSGNVQPLPLELFIDPPAPSLIPLHVYKRVSQSKDEALFDVFVVGDSAGINPPIDILGKNKDGNLLGSIESPNYDKAGNLIGFVYKLKTTELGQYSKFKIGGIASDEFFFPKDSKEPRKKTEQMAAGKSGKSVKSVKR